MVNLVPVSYQAPKEMNEVRVALVEVVKAVRAGKPLSQIAMEDLALLSDALKGVDQIPMEAREDLSHTAQLAGHLGGELLGIFLAPKA